MTTGNDSHSEIRPPSGGSFTILHTEWSNGWGGQEQRIILECCKVRDQGHTVLIACQPGSGLLGKARELGIPVEEVIIRGSYDLRAVRDIYRIIRRHGVNVVNTHSGKDTWVGSFAARLAGVDLLVRTRHLSVPLSNNPLNFVHRMADGIITTGEAIREQLVTHNGLKPERVISIATGVSLEKFDPDACLCADVRKEFGIPGDACVVTMVAVLRSMKRHDLLVNAAGLLRSRYPQLRVLVVGEGPGRDGLSGLIRDAGLEQVITMAGYRSDIPQILSQSDIVVLTSDRFEGVPQSLTQAMAMERPVVASPIGSIPELIRHEETGLLAATGDAVSFADAIARLLDDESLRKSLGKAARRHIESGYSDDIMVKKTIDFYRYLLSIK